MSKIKICGLFRECDIDFVNKYQPDFAGFIIDFPKSHRSIKLETAKKLILKLDKKIKSVCVFVDNPVETVERYVEFADIIQLHGQENNEYVEKLRKIAPNTQIWQAFKIACKEDVEKANQSVADKILLDNGYGTGKQFNWSLAEGFEKDFILAGGINEQNICDAIQKYKPFAVDLSSGAETNKLKDENKIKELVTSVRNFK